MKAYRIAIVLGLLTTPLAASALLAPGYPGVNTGSLDTALPGLDLRVRPTFPVPHVEIDRWRVEINERPMPFPIPDNYPHTPLDVKDLLPSPGIEPRGLD